MVLYGQDITVPGRVLVMGAGTAGRHAAALVSRRWPMCQLHVVDLQQELPSELPGIHHSSTDALEFLRLFMNEAEKGDRVVPCVPFHAVFSYLLKQFGYSIPVPVTMAEKLPGVVKGRDGCIYSSISDFLCPQDCSEPDGLCPVTGDPRQVHLYDLIDEISYPMYRTMVIRLKAVLPGMVSFSTDALSELVRSVRDQKGRYLIATASSCHGVVNGFIH